jgi:hypothetical protein
MGNKQFLMQLTATTGISAVICAGLHQVPAIAPHFWVSISSILTFIIISLGLFFYGKKMARSENKYAFNHLITASVLGKIVISMVILMIYFKGFSPENRLFVVPFLIVYAIFTIFETSFLTKLSKIKSGSKF